MSPDFNYRLEVYALLQRVDDAEKPMPDDWLLWADYCLGEELCARVEWIGGDYILGLTPKGELALKLWQEQAAKNSDPSAGQSNTQGTPRRKTEAMSSAATTGVAKLAESLPLPPDYPTHDKKLYTLLDARLPEAGSYTAGKPGQMKAEDCPFSADFRSGKWGGIDYVFTQTQAACVRVLWEAWKTGKPVVGATHVLTEAGSECKKLRDVFGKGSHPAWSKMIVDGPSKGTCRLANPK